ncbi:hypothetical protein [Ornithinibacillus sp. FSL M8-0202]|uniref:hypothetical protein n=1 Tax=Ornithinibacillus sp. FSL M8-0202 TaxID=2921616 RepID=UPI0030D5D763
MKSKIIREALIFVGGFIVLLISYSTFAYFRTDTLDLQYNIPRAFFVIVFIRVVLWLLKSNGKNSKA